MQVDYIIHKSQLRGNAEYFPSKSNAQRIMLCNLFATNPLVTNFGEECEDLHLTAKACESVGKGEPIMCGDNATLFRLLMPMLCIVRGRGEFLLSKRLYERTSVDLSDFAFAFGLSVEVKKFDDHYVLDIVKKQSSTCFHMRAERTSQFLSGVLMAMPLGNVIREVCVDGDISSVGYVRLTQRVMRDYGVFVERNGNEFYVPQKEYSLNGSVYCENDWSLGAVWLTAAAIGGNVTFFGNDDDFQPDKSIIGILSEAGCEIKRKGRGYNVTASTIKGFSADLAQIPDLALLLALLGSCAQGESKLYGMERLRLKESDRVTGACALLRSMGASFDYDNGCLTIRHADNNKSNCYDSFGDHRIAMACVAASALGEIHLKNADCTGKSCKSFYNRFCGLGGSYDVIDVGK